MKSFIRSSAFVRFFCLIGLNALANGLKNSCSVKEYKLWGIKTNYDLVANEDANSKEFLMPSKLVIFKF
jgi:hypothetical protein